MAGLNESAEGRVLFIPLSAPGDHARVRVTEIEKRYAQAEIVEILEPSPLRQKPPCAVFGRCGGCALQHLAHPAQITYKQGVDAFLVTDRLTPAERDQLMGGSLAAIYGWAPR